MFRVARYPLLVAVVVVSLPACSGRNARTADPVSAAPESELATPSVEPRGPETPATGGGGGVAIPVASLPIGGQSEPEGGKHQCVPVNWLDPPNKPRLPDGVSVTVTGIQIKPPGSFKKNGGGCGGAPGCDASFAFTPRRMACSVPVTATGTGDSGRLLLTGSVNCPTGQGQQCKDLAASVTGASIQLRQPDKEQESSSEKSTPTSAS